MKVKIFNNGYPTNPKIKVKISRVKFKKELGWTKNKRRQLESRILNLRDDQIAALFYLVNIIFDKNDIKKIIKEIKKYKHESINLGTLLSEANSKKNLLWWLSYFESNRR